MATIEEFLCKVKEYLFIKTHIFGNEALHFDWQWVQVSLDDGNFHIYATRGRYCVDFFEHKLVETVPSHTFGSVLYFRLNQPRYKNEKKFKIS